MTTGEIASLLKQRIKIFDNPQVKVDVRDYAKPRGDYQRLCQRPWDKNFATRSDAVIYTMLAEALVLPEAARATITREGVAPIVVDLKDANSRRHW